MSFSAMGISLHSCVLKDKPNKDYRVREGHGDGFITYCSWCGATQFAVSEIAIIVTLWGKVYVLVRWSHSCKYLSSAQPMTML